MARMKVEKAMLILENLCACKEAPAYFRGAVKTICTHIKEAQPHADNSAMDAMREISAVINGRGDNVTKVLKCKDILARHR